jgi:succinate dehydrogenase/fumarate reductase flavoprotein subunit
MARKKSEEGTGDRTDVPRSISRRGFLKGSALAGVGGAVGVGGATAISGLSGREASAQLVKWDRESDVVVIGSGAAGMAAAITARDRGASVLVVEQNFDVGGMAINSGGIVQLGCGNKYQKDAGVEDSPDRFFNEWIQRDHPLTRYSDREIVRKFADEAVATFDFLSENGVKWLRVGVPHGILSVARQVVAAPWPNRNETPMRSTRPNNGGAGVIRSLERSARQKGVEFLLQHRMTKIHRENPTSGRVLGITAIEVDKMTRPLQRTVNIRAHKGIVVATGGHVGNVNFRRMFDPRLTEEYAAHCGQCNPRNADGELAAMAVGASLWTTQLQTNEHNAQMRPSTVLGMRMNGGARFPPESEYFIRTKAVGLEVADFQNLILVKETGKRFWDETLTDEEERRLTAERGVTPYRPTKFLAAALEWSGDPKRLNGGGPIWAIFDSDAVRREEWQVRPPYVEEGYFFVADTLEELARQIKANPYQWRSMPGTTLRQTVERYNSFVDAGKDADFNKPAPMYKIQAPPFYAAWATPGPDDCYAGLRINTNAQVLDTSGEIIAGLYCSGDSASGIAIHGLGKAFVFGRLAGLHASAQHT